MDTPIQWALSPDVVFLNHGSFGSCPKEILQHQHQLRLSLEADPMQFFIREFEQRLDQARNTLGHFIGANPEQLAFVPNATTGVNTIIRSISWQPGDEIITTNHDYSACRNTIRRAMEQNRGRLVVVQIPLPIQSAEQLQNAILAAVTPKTRLVLLDHITSPTGIIFPVASIIAALSARGIDTLVDGAHAPGMVPLQLDQLGAAYYTGNCHKWLCTPKGAAFLYVRTDKQPGLCPLVTSNNAYTDRSDRSRFHLEFDWVGTHDPTPYLCIPTAIDLLGNAHPDGWAGVMRHNHQLAVAARRVLCAALHISPPCPDDLIGSLAAIPLPRCPTSLPIPTHKFFAHPLQEALYADHNIEVPVFRWPTPDHHMLRIACQLYNTLDQYQHLATILSQTLEFTS